MHSVRLALVVDDADLLITTREDLRWRKAIQSRVMVGKVVPGKIHIEPAASFSHTDKAPRVSSVILDPDVSSGCRV